jgi:hypothetical protein
MAEATYYGDREHKDYTNSSGADYDNGQLINVNGMAALVQQPGGIANGEEGSILIRGIIKVAHVALVGSPGQVVGWDEDGDPYDGTSGDGCATPKLGNADFLLGTTIAGVDSDGGMTETISATTKYILVDLNVLPEGLGFLRNRTWEQVSADKTLDVQDVGKVMLVDTDAKTITLPAVSTEFEFVVMNGGKDGTVAVTVSPNTNDKIMGADLAGVDNKDRINTKATAMAGDYIYLRYGSADGWIVVEERGTWAAES